jgi:hypothetical protein
MPIKLPNLDDRTYASLVEEARAMIPVHAPEWTNHNASDPGITLVEMMAYVTEMLLYRLNRVTVENVVAFLNLIDAGSRKPDAYRDRDRLTEEVRKVVIELRRPYRAITYEDFNRLVIDNYHERAARVFTTTLKDMRNEKQVDFISVFVVPVRRSTVLIKRAKAYSEHSSDLRRPGHVYFTLISLEGEHLYVGMESIFDAIKFSLHERGPRYALEFKYSKGGDEDKGGAQWADLTAAHKLMDLTSGWAASGLVVFAPPTDWQPSTVDDKLMYWVRVSVAKPQTAASRAVIPVASAFQVAVQSVPAFLRSTVLLRRTGGYSVRNPGDINFPLISLEGEYLYVGMESKFDAIRFSLDARGSGYALEFKYSTGGDEDKGGVQWANLTEAQKLADRTSGWAASGLVVFAPPEDWQPSTVNASLMYWVRISSKKPAGVASAFQVSPEKKGEALLSDLEKELDKRRLLTTRLKVAGPSYKKIAVKNATLHLKPGVFEADAIKAAKEELSRFFHPLIGGRDGTGWPFGRHVYVSEVIERLAGLAGVDFVEPGPNPLGANWSEASKSFATLETPILAGRAASATFELRQGGASSGKPITINSTNNSLAGLRDAINAAGAGVVASVADAGGGAQKRLVLNSTATGAAGRVELVETTATGTGASLALTAKAANVYLEPFELVDFRISESGFETRSAPERRGSK